MGGFMEEIQRIKMTHSGVIALVNLVLTIAAIFIYIGVEHGRIGVLERDIDRLNIHMEYIEEHGTRGAPERLGEIDRRLDRLEVKMDTVIKLVK